MSQPPLGLGLATYTIRFPAFVTDVTYRRGRDVDLKTIVDSALSQPRDVERVVVLRRTGSDIAWTAGRDISWEDFVMGAAGHPTGFATMESNEQAYGIDLGSVERVFSAGEVLNAPAWEWFQKKVFQNRIPVIDHMWQADSTWIWSRIPASRTEAACAAFPCRPASARFGVCLR